MKVLSIQCIPSLFICRRQSKTNVLLWLVSYSNLIFWLGTHSLFLLLNSRDYLLIFTASSLQFITTLSNHFIKPPKYLGKVYSCFSIGGELTILARSVGRTKKDEHVPRRGNRFSHIMPPTNRLPYCTSNCC